METNHLLSWTQYRHDGDVAALALLIYQSHPEFYDLFSQDRLQVLEAIRQQLEEPESELGHTKALIHEGALVGAVSWYHTREADERKLASLRIMFDVISPTEACFEGLQKFKHEVPAIRADGCYLARITVASSSRGTGLGQILLREFESESERMGCHGAYLHVWRSNSRAIRFYQAAGYQAEPPMDLAYLTMSKSLVITPLRIAS